MTKPKATVSINFDTEENAIVFVRILDYLRVAMLHGPQWIAPPGPEQYDDDDEFDPELHDLIPGCINMLTHFAYERSLSERDAEAEYKLKNLETRRTSSIQTLGQIQAQPGGPLHDPTPFEQAYEEQVGSFYCDRLHEEEMN